MAEPSRIKTMVIDVPLPDPVVEKIKSTFPDIEFAFHDDPERDAKLARAQAYFHWHLSPETLAAAPNLIWYQSVAAGVDRVLSPELLARNLIVTNTSGLHASNIAEHLLSMMLAFARRLPSLILAQARHDWQQQGPFERTFKPFELNEQTLLVAGYGDIGQRLARIASGIGMTVDAVKRTVNGDHDEFTREIAPIAGLGRLLATADHVAVCLPLTPATRHLFDEKAFSEIKTGAFIYNIGRGPIIDSDAMLAALRSGKLGGAGLDVTDPEPLPADSPFWDLPNVIITSHSSGITPHYWERGAEILMTNISRISSGQMPINLVDQQLGY